jgi:hypothetical protein
LGDEAASKEVSRKEEAAITDLGTGHWLLDVNRWLVSPALFANAPVLNFIRYRPQDQRGAIENLL